MRRLKRIAAMAILPVAGAATCGCALAMVLGVRGPRVEDAMVACGTLTLAAYRRLA